MVTGDNGLTASAIGKEIGLHTSEAHVIEGRQLDTLDDARLDALLDQPNLLFARHARAQAAAGRGLST